MVIPRCARKVKLKQVLKLKEEKGKEDKTLWGRAYLVLS